jgi:hypothetical protein
MGGYQIRFDVLTQPSVFGRQPLGFLCDLCDFFASFAVKGLTSQTSLKSLNRKGRKEKPQRSLKVQETLSGGLASVQNQKQDYLCDQRRAAVQ